MSDVENTPPAVNRGEFAWGTDEIANIIERTPRQTYHMLSKGEIKSAQKKGGKWVAHRTALRSEFGAA